jgi:hypothetical protein
MALADSLNTPKASAFLSGKGMPPTPKGYVGGQEIGPIKEELAQARTKAEKDVGMADVNIERVKEQQKISELESQETFAKKTAEDVKVLPERERLKAKRQEFTDMKFVPTKDTAQDIAGLFSLVNVIGMAMGGGSKQNAQQAMYAMNGMLEGYQKGRGDLYKKEKESFDKNFKAMQEAVKTLEKDYEEALKIYQYDKEAGEITRKLAVARSGSSQIIKALEDRVGMIGALNFIKDTSTSVDKVVEVLNNLQKSSDDRILKERNLEIREMLAQLRADKKPGGDIPKDKDTNNQFLARKSVVNHIKDINSLLDNPKYSRLIGPETRFTPDIIQNLRDNFPELSQKLARIQAIEFEIGGKNLTKSEQAILEPLYGWKGLTVKALRQRLKGVAEDFEDKNNILQIRFPGLIDYASKIDDYYFNKPTSEAPATSQRRSFSSLAEAEAANLPQGTKITINGKNATVE